MMVRATLPALSAYIPAKPALERLHNAPLVHHQTSEHFSRTTRALATMDILVGVC